MTIAIIGLSYVGLQLAVEFGKKLPVFGFDIYQARVDELRAGHVHTLGVEPAEFALASQSVFISSLDELKAANVFIVTVPTPIDDHRQPDMTPLVKASQTIGKVLKSGLCIRVDPYYLTHKAQAIGYYPEVILSGSRINDNKGKYVGSQLVKQMIKSSI